mmetsp:Transcript_22326/g.50477  ORF Transcript_22326/g.50477 Transcript_22326/m.50477 type:complete len:283 (-) Transcript_22326:83-931(-)|eukprot:CAMPEP_0172600192 /NCGR_PEP_ID=MMETSP1068-20121228/20347_1 /TAXON_ID=35684 /ORGANISM="Pseudopedinella elastica, Strain CCMP716" /LENGTH=282 /DNA_ID=CAMNT_0013400739 /DNA_START=140 /DNA_END=988 /DNA_ORIENTATION=+
MGGTKDHPIEYFTASGIAAVVNFPLWKASAIAQAGFKTKAKGAVAKYVEALMPPYKGVVAVIAGMTWARGAIFYGSDSLKEMMMENGFDQGTSTILPTLLISTGVQVVNQPIVRSSITIQNPATQARYSGTVDACIQIGRKKGWMKLWHGTSAGVMKTVPKYCTAILMKDLCEVHLPRPENPTDTEELARSAVKSVIAGTAGAALTNPLDVLRNEMFKTDLGIRDTLGKLLREEGASFMVRGVAKNLVAVAIPIAITIFTTDALVNAKLRRGESVEVKEFKR